MRLWHGLLIGAALLAPGLAGEQTPRRVLRYDPAAETTISGTVIEYREHHEGRMDHLLVKSEAGEVKVFLGPKHYLDKHKFTLHVNDAVEITGCKVKTRDGALFLARDVRKGDTTLVLRDKVGRPLWRRGGRRVW